MGEEQRRKGENKRKGGRKKWEGEWKGMRHKGGLQENGEKSHFER